MRSSYNTIYYFGIIKKHLFKKSENIMLQKIINKTKNVDLIKNFNEYNVFPRKSIILKICMNI